jgi:hypothetical protein
VKKRRTVFISYRRRDAPGHAGHLADSLKKAGFDVFFDRIGPRPGEDFEKVIRNALARSAVVLVVIGDEWTRELQQRQSAGPDYVLLELKLALSQLDGCEIIPVLVDGASVPQAEHVPEDIKPLLGREAFHLRPSDWDYDIKRLTSLLCEVIPTWRCLLRRWWPWWLVALLALVFVGGIAVSQVAPPWPWSATPSPTLVPASATPDQPPGTVAPVVTRASPAPAPTNGRTVTGSPVRPPTATPAFATATPTSQIRR